MRKYISGYLLIILVLFLFQAGTAQKVDNKALWCFTLSEASNSRIKKEGVDFQVKYRIRETGKWKSVAKSQCGWGWQPDFTLEPCYQFYAPSTISAFEITIFRAPQPVRILIDEFPDTLSKYKLIGFGRLIADIKNNQYAFKDLKEISVSLHASPEMYSMGASTHPRIETTQPAYHPDEPIKIYIESRDTLQSVILSGCGTPGTLYRVQQWLDGSWIDYQNMWSVKCVPQKYEVIRYIVGLSIDKPGLFRVVFDDWREKIASNPILVSNPFLIK
jgi:hypothetical protein